VDLSVNFESYHNCMFLNLDIEITDEHHFTWAVQQCMIVFTTILQNRDVRTLLPLTLKQLSSASTTGESNFCIDGVDIKTVSSFLSSAVKLVCW